MTFSMRVFFFTPRPESDNPMIPHAKWSILYAAAILAALGWAFGPMPAAAQLAPWQQPPGSAGPDRAETVYPADSTDPSSTPWASNSGEQDGSPLGLRDGSGPNWAYEIVHDRVWFRGEFL